MTETGPMSRALAAEARAAELEAEREALIDDKHHLEMRLSRVAGLEKALEGLVNEIDLECFVCLLCGGDTKQAEPPAHHLQECPAAQARRALAMFRGERDD